MTVPASRPSRSGKVALVTGASAGLGVQLANLFAADGHDLVLVARRRAELEAVSKNLTTKYRIEAHVLREDLADRASPGRIAAALEQRGIDIEFLVNNAGFGSRGGFGDADLVRQLDMVQVNVTALIHLTRLLLPGMLARRSGRILNLGSTAGFQPGPFMAIYYASKAFVNSFTEALAFELAGTGVSATVCCPGATATEFSEVAGSTNSRLFRLGAMSAPRVAAHAYRAMMRGKILTIPGVLNKLTLQVQRVSPRRAVRRVAARLNEIVPS